ncbi:MAG: putative Ig domain-containing protein, partial [Miltoncostaeaceae bacterium]
DAAGRTSAELLGGSTSFRVSHGGLSQQKAQNTATDPTVTFQTVAVTVRLVDSTGTGIAGGEVRYSAGGWQPFGTTDATGQTTTELLGGATSFRVYYGGQSQQQSQNTATDPTVTFQTGRVRQGSGPRVVEYWVSGWVPFVDGVELLPGAMSFRLDDATQQTHTVIAGDSIYVPDMAPSPTLDYTPTRLSLTRTQAMSAVAPTASTSGTPTYSVSPALPAGLSLNTSTGAITGTPTATQSAKTHTITVTDDGGTADDAIDIEVANPAPAVDYPASAALTRTEAMTPITPSGATSGTPTYSVSPALPAGLSIDSSTGEISGTPTVTAASATYTVTLTDAAGSAQASIQIEITEAPAAPAPAPGGGTGRARPTPQPPIDRSNPTAHDELPKNAAKLPAKLPVRYDPKRDAFIVRVNFTLRRKGVCRRTCRATSTIHERVRNSKARIERARARGQKVDPWRTRKLLGRAKRLRVKTRKKLTYDIPVARRLVGTRSQRKGNKLIMLVRLGVNLRTPKGVKRVRKDSIILVTLARYDAATRTATARGANERSSRGAAPSRRAPSLGGRGGSSLGGRP